MGETGALTAAEKLKHRPRAFESGVSMMREKLKRDHLTEAAERIEERLREWIGHRPGELGSF